jgi:D-glycero-D-manno-heptose 1,7-bisphosphate phosphatase
VQKAIFFDRDGVLNKSIVKNGKPFPPSHLSEVELTDSIFELCTYLKSLGYLLLVVTNQPDVARGTQTAQVVNEINDYLKGVLRIDKVYSCMHDDRHNCDCRKPKSGMIIEGVKDFSLDINRCYLVGDRWKDIVAGQNVGIKTIFIDYGYAEKDCSPDYVVKEIKDIFNIIKS